MVVFKNFVRECMEAFILTLVIFMISDKPMNKDTMQRILKISLLLGGVNVALPLFDEESHVRVKDGMKNSLRHTMLASARK
jgi:gamma-glutamyl-gamma-aminobutyrate hydrolase PuuD